MKDTGPQKDVKIEEAIVNEWINKFSQEGIVDQLDPKILKPVMEYCGANFEIGEDALALHGLREYSNAAKAESMRAVWGEKYDQYKNWTKEYIAKYESSTGDTLPELKPSGVKNSGMVQFFGELTSYAAGQIDFTTLKIYQEARAKNGKLWAEDRKDERTKIIVPTSKEPILPSSFPPGFPLDAWKFLTTSTPQ